MHTVDKNGRVRGSNAVTTYCIECIWLFEGQGLQPDYYLDISPLHSFISTSP